MNSALASNKIIKVDHFALIPFFLAQLSLEKKNLNLRLNWQPFCFVWISQIEMYVDDYIYITSINNQIILFYSFRCFLKLIKSLKNFSDALRIHYPKEMATITQILQTVKIPKIITTKYNLIMVHIHENDFSFKHKKYKS